MFNLKGLTEKPDALAGDQPVSGDIEYLHVGTVLPNQPKVRIFNLVRKSPEDDQMFKNVRWVVKSVCLCLIVIRAIFNILLPEEGKFCCAAMVLSK